MELKESRTCRLIFSYVNDHANDFKDVLGEAVSIPSVSQDHNYREACFNMINWITCKMKALGISVEECSIGKQIFEDGRTLCLPPILLGTLGNDPDLSTICIYGHLDVHPAEQKDGWNTLPFKMTEIDGKLYGRGVCDNKGSSLCWLNAVKSYKACNLKLPVNLKFVFQSMEEGASQGLAPLLQERKGSFFKDVDLVVISDSCWLGKTKPCLTYATRGRCTFFIDIKCAKKDLESGREGGIINEAMTDLVFLLNTLIDRKGKILIPGIYDDVQPLTQDEVMNYKLLDFKVTQYKNELGTDELLYDEDKVNVLMHRWRYPSLSIHRIESSNEMPRKPSIPHKVSAEFSLHIVPNQTPEKVEQLVLDHLKAQWEGRGSVNNLKISLAESFKPWITDYRSKIFEAAKKAAVRAYGATPDLTRLGRTMKTALAFHDKTGKNIIMIPMGAMDDAVHCPNEKINVRNYIQGIKMCSAFIYEISQSGLKEENVSTDVGTFSFETQPHKILTH